MVCPDKKADQTIQTAVHDFKPEYQFFVETHGHCFKLNKSLLIKQSKHKFELIGLGVKLIILYI